MEVGDHGINGFKLIARIDEDIGIFTGGLEAVILLIVGFQRSY